MGFEKKQWYLPPPPPPYCNIYCSLAMPIITRYEYLICTYTSLSFLYIHFFCVEFKIVATAVRLSFFWVMKQPIMGNKFHFNIICYMLLQFGSDMWQNDCLKFSASNNLGEFVSWHNIALMWISAPNITIPIALFKSIFITSQETEKIPWNTLTYPHLIITWLPYVLQLSNICVKQLTMGITRLQDMKSKVNTAKLAKQKLVIFYVGFSFL